ncbi:MAG: undecaprenyl-diphosphate phosphatase, partial [Planctomycetota bacterium]
MSILDAIILGLVEGITEYLPISSTGHLIIAAALLGLDSPPDVKQAVNAFNIVIQGGAILAVAGLYRRRVAAMLLGLAGRDPTGRRLAVNILVAFLPAAILGPLLNDAIEARLFWSGPVIAALAFWGAVLIFLTPWQRRHFHGDEHAEPVDAHSYVDIEHLTWRRA